MKLLTNIFLFLCMTLSVTAFAGSGHNHGHSHEQKPISSEEAQSRAEKKVTALVKAGSIDKTWAGIKSNNIKQITFSHDPEWVISFSNNKISDASKQSLYLFYSLDGQYIAANYTGK